MTERIESRERIIALKSQAKNFQVKGTSYLNHDLFYLRERIWD